jgi:hypothetical protein
MDGYAPGPHPRAAFDYRDPSAPFRIAATLGEWRTWADPPGAVRLAVRIAHGTLFDDDKGPVDLAGLEVGLGPPGAEPTVCNPGTLTELQQAGIVDAVARHLRTLGVRLPTPDGHPGDAGAAPR